MRLPASLATLTAVVVTTLAPTASAATAPERLTAIAERSVVSVGADPLRAGFAIGDSRTVVSTAGAGEDPRVTTARGTGGDANVRGTLGPVDVLDVDDEVGLKPLSVERRTVRDGGRAYVLQGPLGYTEPKLQRVRLRVSDRGDALRLHIRADLPASAAGAPVVTSGGRLIGALGTPSRRTWSLTSADALLEAVRAAESGPPFPPWTLLAALVAVGLLAVIGVMAGVALRRWRGRPAPEPAQRLHQLPSNPPDSPGPLVRRRPQDGYDDVEVIVHTRRADE